ncbi:HpcH/HpaI aldolase family protein [Devosia sp. XGJD_8]|uniref:HpcH/HpaI aldolase family protein n=1 Tax=Devosia sp. XGJD_8 TaxID=3391187 RepID=UPI003984F2CB
MRNPVRDSAITRAIATGIPARGFHMNVAVPLQIELLGGLGFDFVFLDAEHGTFSLPDIEECCRAAELYALTVVARVPAADGNGISQFLNAGVQGIVVPHVDTIAEARLATQSCRYAPQGLRPSGGSRASSFWRGVDDMSEALVRANANITLSVQIESREALALLPDMLAMGGIDYFTIGKQDLSQSMGYARLADGFPDEVLEAVDAATTLIHAQGGKLKDDVMSLCRVNKLLLDGARQFLRKAQQ